MRNKLKWIKYGLIQQCNIQYTICKANKTKFKKCSEIFKLHDLIGTSFDWYIVCIYIFTSIMINF